MEEAPVSTPPGSAAPRRELILAAALEARLQQNAYDRFEDAAADFFGVNRAAPGGGGGAPGGAGPPRPPGAGSGPSAPPGPGRPAARSTGRWPRPWRSS